MARNAFEASLPRNKKGGLNLNWAIRQALDKLGTDAKHGEVKTFIKAEYGNLGKKATENNGSLSTGVTVMRKKLREELSKVPAPKAAKSAPAAVKTAPVPATPSDFGRLHDYVVSVLKPAVEMVAAAGDRTALKRALTVVEHAEASLGDDGWKKLQAVVAACG